MPEREQLFSDVLKVFNLHNISSKEVSGILSVDFVGNIVQALEIFEEVPEVSL